MSNTALELLRARFATRALSTQPLPEALVADLIEAARLAPSCSNKQPWRFAFLTSETARAAGLQCLAEGNRAWCYRAPLLIMAWSRAQDDCLPEDGRHYHQLDLGHATMSLMLAATAAGLVARPMAGFDPAAVRAYLGLPAEDEPLVMLAVGYPTEDVSFLPERLQGVGNKPRVRRPAEEIVRQL